WWLAEIDALLGLGGQPYQRAWGAGQEPHDPQQKETHQLGKHGGDDTGQSVGYRAASCPALRLAKPASSMSRRSTVRWACLKFRHTMGDFMFETAIAGSLPKPAWLAETEKLWPQWTMQGPELQQAKADATLLWIKAQEDAGLDVISDG
ncbi:5-methyltetrahydropteroyltriglutamate--homocysteine methyltransferase, partial [Bacillus cereus SJ1]